MINDAIAIIKKYLSDFAFDYAYCMYEDISEYRNIQIFTCQELLRNIKKHPEDDPYMVVERYKNHMDQLSTTNSLSMDLKWRFSTATNTCEDILQLIEYYRLKEIDYDEKVFM